MEANNLEKKAKKIKSMILDRDPKMKVYKISESTGTNMGVSKKINGYRTHLAWVYPEKNKILVRRQEYKVFFKNLKGKYNENFNQELDVGEWVGFNVQ